jgi:glutamate/tyrosine decarboxylase-like PLP-dependent enzyme
MDPDALERMVVADRARGDVPFCVVAQLGSVNVGAVDPLAPIADVCARHGLWLHGDGAVGLLAAGLPETRPLFAGLERADSLSFDAHKWLGVPHDCGVLLVRHGERLRRAFSITAPYLRGEGEQADDAIDFMEHGPQMSRAFRALKVWMALRFFGTEGLRSLMAKNIALARRLHELVRDHPDFQVLHEPTLSLYCFRCVPHAVAGRQHEPTVAAALDQLNDAIAREVQGSGLAFLMTTRLRGQVALRFSIASQRTEAEDIDRTFEAIAAAGRRLGAPLTASIRSRAAQKIPVASAGQRRER